MHRLTNLPSRSFLLATVLIFACRAASAEEPDDKAPVCSVRFATFNVSLYGERAGDVLRRMESTDDRQAQCLAEIIQRVRPDVLLLCEVDYDRDGNLITQFLNNYLSNGQNVSQSPEGPAEPIEYPYRFLAPSNTGIHSGMDLDRNGRIAAQPGSNDYGGDSWGYGRYPGQYAMVLLSRYPIDADRARTFQHFLWKDMPGALLPDDPATPAAADWYSPEMLEHFPLSSKSHWDVPVQIGEQVVHVLTSHPTPPTYDGPEDRNGRRNHDELRFWVDYIGSSDRHDQALPESYIYDDRGNRGGLPDGASFVIMGDLNGDPLDGQGREGIARLLTSPRVLQTDPPASDGAAEQSALQGGANASHRGNAHNDTLDAADEPGPGNLRLDYVLPSANLRISASGVFWPTMDQPTFRLVGTHPFPSSDHRLVWADVVLEQPVGSEQEADK